MKEVKQEAAVFAMNVEKNVEKLLNMLRALDPVKVGTIIFSCSLYVVIKKMLDLLGALLILYSSSATGKGCSINHYPENGCSDSSNNLSIHPNTFKKGQIHMVELSTRVVR